MNRIRLGLDALSLGMMGLSLIFIRYKRPEHAIYCVTYAILLQLWGKL